LRKVIEEENDVFYFKKYVIEYTDKEWEEAKTVLPVDYQGLGLLLMYSDVFDHVKAHKDSPYSLLYQVAHKLPFTMMRAEKKSYEPVQDIRVDETLLATFQWVESLSDPVAENPTEEEVLVASDAIDVYLTSIVNEEHQD